MLLVHDRYHAGISKDEWMLQQEAGRGWFWNKRRRHQHRTYGLRCHFGGWLYERNHRNQRLCMRRIWRKRARREAKQWIAEYSE